MQANPTKTNMQILQALKASATQSVSPDNYYGWGIPNMCVANDLLNATTVGVHEFNKSSDFKLYPNPAQEQVAFSLNQKPQEVYLTDLLGKRIEVIYNETSSNLYLISLKNVTKGVYFISVKTADGLINTKLIKQ